MNVGRYSSPAGRCVCRVSCGTVGFMAVTDVGPGIRAGDRQAQCDAYQLLIMHLTGDACYPLAVVEHLTTLLAQRGILAVAELVPALLQVAADILAIHNSETGAEPLDVVRFLQQHRAAGDGDV